MKTVILSNPAIPRGAPIIDYPISVAKEDEAGEYAIDPDTGEFFNTGKTLEWSIRPGEKLSFDEYVGKVLSEKYHFLILICSVCQEPFEFTATKTGSISAHTAYLDHSCKTKKQTKGLEDARDAKESGIVYCRHCKGEDSDKEYKGRVQLAMHVGSKHQDVAL